MAIFRKIHVTFWEDSFISSLTPEKKFFYLYLLTNSRTRQCGIYEIHLSKICAETGYNLETVNKLIKYLVKTGKIAWSVKTNEIAIKNWKRYNESESPQVLACIEKELKLVKNKDLIQYVYSMVTTSQEEQEEEQEQEEEKQPEQAQLWPSFEDFWELYAKKIDRPKCEKKWAKIKQGEREKIMSHVEAYVLSTPDVQYRKNPATYLNNESWNNEIVKNGNATKQISRDDRVKYINAKYGTAGTPKE